MQQKIAKDFTSRIIARSKLSGITGSLELDDSMPRTLQVQRKPKGDQGHRSWNRNLIQRDIMPRMRNMVPLASC